MTVVPVSADEPPESIARFFQPPAALREDFGPYRSPLHFNDGHPVRNASDWRARRGEILKAWHEAMGAWPPPVEHSAIETLETTPRDRFAERKVRLRVAPDRVTDGYLLVPAGAGPHPTVLVVFYEPETAIGQGKPGRAFALELTRRGFLTLAIGFDPRVIDPAKSGLSLQPLSYLAYAASNAYSALVTVPEVDAKRVAVMGHSYGGKWAMFAAALDERFACGVWSDPGIAFDETRPSVNYWEPWYLGWDPTFRRKPGLITAENPRTGAYKQLRATGHDLHEIQALMAPRPFLVSGGSEDSPQRWPVLNQVVAVNALLGARNRVAMTNRAGHDPTAESNEQVYLFLEYVLKPGLTDARPQPSR